MEGEGASSSRGEKEKGDVRTPSTTASGACFDRVRDYVIGCVEGDEQTAAFMIWLSKNYEVFELVGSASGVIFLSIHLFFTAKNDSAFNYFV